MVARIVIGWKLYGAYRQAEKEHQNLTIRDAKMSVTQEVAKN